MRKVALLSQCKVGGLIPEPVRKVVLLVGVKPGGLILEPMEEKKLPGYSNQSILNICHGIKKKRKIIIKLLFFLNLNIFFFLIVKFIPRNFFYLSAPL